MPVFSKARANALAVRVAALLGGQVKPCRMSFGLLSTARHVVKARYAGMQLEVYVFEPWLEVWVQNFRLRASGEAAFAVGEPNRVMAMVEPVEGLMAVGRPVFRRPWEVDESIVRAWVARPESEATLRRLALGNGESLSVLSEQMTARLRAGDDAQLRDRFDALGLLFAGSAGPAAAAGPAAWPEPLTVVIGEGTEAPSTPHRFGGALEGGPECRNCRRPLHQLLSLDTAAPPLAGVLGALGVPRLPVAACLNCQTLSSPLVLALEDGRWIVREQAPSPSFDDFPAVLPARPVRLEAGNAPPGHRLGGAPEWIQSDETPDCPGCSEPMAFLAQLETDDRVGVQFGDDGRLYAFVCPRCVMVAALIQST